ncbi:MAG TPA: efflux RND transporter permease subunit [Kofleriaceae bacterium]|jgi:CzcA family heavy metal efflux pump|nr:efflux RND transporter permease subunit [Kofleriaceae bacterium]
MKLVAWLRQHASLVWIAVLGLAATGAVSIFQLPSGIYPEMQFPRVIVVAKAGQLSPDLVEAQMTRPLEQALAIVPGIRHVRARTIRGAVELSLQLTDGTDPLTAQYACQAAVDHVELPRGATTVVQRVLPTSVPVITFNVVSPSGATTDLRRLREVAERIIRPAIVRVPGVGGVEVAGGRVRQIQLLIHPAELAALHLTPSQLAQKIEAEDQVIAAGRVWDQHQTLPVVYDAQAADLEQLRQLPIATGPTGPVPLSAVADVRDGNEDPDVIIASRRGEAVAVSVARLPGASTPAVVDGVRGALAQLRAGHTLPPDVELVPVYDQADLVDQAMVSVRDAILIGIALSLLVIAVSLRDWRAGLVAAIPVPLTLLGTFAVMRWLGVTLNLMSLGGLAVAIGLVVDDAIVVTEGIVRRLEDGHPVREAIELGTRDMFAAVIGTTFTTVVVFAPLVLLTGVTGSFLGALAVTLAIAVLLSMGIALTLIPLLAGWLRHRPRRAARETDRGGRRVDDKIRWLVRHRSSAAVAIAVLVIAGTLAWSQLGTGFLPQMDEGAFVIDFFLPAGTSLEETARATEVVDDVLAHTPEVAAFTRRTGTELGPATATMQSRGDIMVRLVARDRRDGIRAVIDRVRDELHGKVPEARFEYVQVLQDVLNDLEGAPAPVEVRVLGDDPRLLESYAERAGERLEKLPQLVDFFDGLEGRTPILDARSLPAQLSRLGVDPQAVGADLSIALSGREVAQVLLPERTIGVRLRYPDDIRYDAEALARSPIAYGPRALPLGQVVGFDRPLAPAVLRRDGLRSAVLMTASTRTGDLGGAEAAVREALRGVPVPPATQIEIGGQAASARSARGELVTVALTAVVLVLLILILQLHSLRYALVVLIGAPLSTVGGLLVLAVTGIPLDVSSMTGLILLVGLVVKNGILLLENAQHHLAAGDDLEAALIAAARRRLRPILMTTAATLAGLAPLALGLGAGAELQRPLAVAVIGGLTLATVVTLVVTPGLTALLARRPAAQAPVPPG